MAYLAQAQLALWSLVALQIFNEWFKTSVFGSKIVYLGVMVHNMDCFFRLPKGVRSSSAVGVINLGMARGWTGVAEVQTKVGYH